MFVSAHKLMAPTADELIAPAVEALVVRVIGQALADLSIPAYREDVERFFAGPAFRRYCGLLGWSEVWARRRIARFTESQRSHTCR